MIQLVSRKKTFETSLSLTSVVLPGINENS